MFALWTQVTFLRPFSRAYSKANRTIRSLLATLIGLMLTPVALASVRIVLSADRRLTVSISSAVAPWPWANSTPAYRSSTFSRTMTRSTSS